MHYEKGNELELNNEIIWNSVETTKPDDGQIVIVSYKEYHGLMWEEITSTVARYHFYFDEYIDILNINHEIHTPLYWAEMPESHKKKEKTNE